METLKGLKSVFAEKQNEEALINAFKIEELEERLEMSVTWSIGITIR